MDTSFVKLSQLLFTNIKHVSRSTIQMNSSYEKSLCEELGLELELNKQNLRYRDSFLTLDNEKHGIEIKKAKDGMHFDCIRYAEMVKFNIVHENSITLVLFYNSDFEIIEIILIKTLDLVFKLFENTPFNVIDFYVEQYKKDKNSTFLRKLSKKELKNLAHYVIDKNGILFDGVILPLSQPSNLTSDTQISATSDVHECGLIAIGKKIRTDSKRKMLNTFVFKSKRYYYTNGYTYSKIVWGDLHKCTISYKNKIPQFIVQNTNSGEKKIGRSPTDAWTQMCKIHNKKQGSKTCINGPLYFGLRDKLILQKLRF